MNRIDQFKKELRVRGYAYSTTNTYCEILKLIISKFGDRPDIEEFKSYLLTLRSRSYHKQMTGMIHRYFEFVLKEPIDLKDLPYPKKEYKLPEVLSKHEAELIYKQIHNVKHKAIFCLLYGCGLRRSEVLHLKPHDIDRTRMIVNVRQAKNNKDRQVMLDKKLLLLLEQYYRQYRPTEYMFNGQYGNIYSGSSINLFLKYYSKKARVKKKVKAHTLRHSFATHLLEDGVDISIIQKLLGHASLKTTLIYVHISNKHISGIKSPVSSFLK